MLRAVRRLSAAGAFGVMAATVGCGWILGLDEFTDAPPATGAGGEGGGGAPACSSPADCPGAERAAPACEEGVCGLECDTGFADCDGEPGCETSTSTDKDNCGGCGVTCAAYCVGSICNDPVDLAVGMSHACAILQDGSAWCWGEVPGTEPIENRTQPTQVPLPAAATRLAAGGMVLGAPPWCMGHTCALLVDGTVQCWGCNDHGQLGVGDTESAGEPRPLDLANIRQISAGGVHTCALDADDRAFCWGNNSRGQLGDDTTTGALWPVLLSTPMEQLSAGGLHTCGVTPAGSVDCWGSNASGQLGNGTHSDQLSPDTVLLGGVEVACGMFHTCARDAFGAYCWGHNGTGQLGLGNTVEQASPQPLALGQIDALALSEGSPFAAAYDAHSGALVGGELYTWGENSHGQLGTGTAQDAFAPVKTSLTDVEQLALGHEFSCARTKARGILCWGDNSSGQLGNGTKDSTSVPTPVVWP